MSGFFFIFNRNGQPVAPTDLTTPLQQLSHRGPDGIQTHLEGPFGCAFFHFWTTPEDFAQRQPLVHRHSGQWLLFDGRIDNRRDLLAQFPQADRDASISDAELALKVLAEEGIDNLSSLIGPFALILVDPSRRSVRLARDPVGDRTLYYRQTKDLLAVASEECGLLHLLPSPALNPHRVAAFFDLSVPNPRDTFFQGIFELAVGSWLQMTPEDSNTGVFWEFQSQPKALYRDERRCIDTFQTLLFEATQSRLRTRRSVGIMMSGGLDSTTIAAMARQEMSNRQDVELKAFSYIFKNFPTCDESVPIKNIASHLELDSFAFPADSFWPASAWSNWPVNPNTPEDNLYRRLLMGIHQMAVDRECNVLLSGDFGDHHFAGYHLWLWHLLRDGRWRQLPGMLWSEWRRTNWRTALRRAGFGRVMTAKKRGYPPFLTPQAQAFWRPVENRMHRTNASNYRANALLGSINARSVSAESHRVARANIDLRLPFRDRRLLQFSLDIPAYLLYRAGVKKYLLDRISGQRLPSKWRSGAQNLEAFFQFGLSKERDTIRHYLEAHRTSWQPWVDAEYVYASLAPNGKKPPFPLLWWQCMTFSKWVAQNGISPGLPAT